MMELRTLDGKNILSTMENGLLNEMIVAWAEMPRINYKGPSYTSETVIQDVPPHDISVTFSVKKRLGGWAGW